MKNLVSILDSQSDRQCAVCCIVLLSVVFLSVGVLTIRSALVLVLVLADFSEKSCVNPGFSIWQTGRRHKLPHSAETRILDPPHAHCTDLLKFCTAVQILYWLTVQ